MKFATNHLLSALCVALGCFAREWNDTGIGTIVFEEAWSILELLPQGVAPPVGQTSAELSANLLDIHNQRLAQMDENGIDFMVLSCANPCIQGISDPDKAATMAVHVNNVLASAISNNTARFGAFAALSMHNASVAAQELNRTVKELGFLGALVNDYQQSGVNNDMLLFYDQPEYDVFWEMVTDLDVPVYFHPRGNVPTIHDILYGHAHWLSGPSQEFAATLSTHLLGLCTNGVFDRFPSLKVISGHLGERIPSDLFRIDDQLARQVPQGMPMLRNVSSYWRTNLFETTSGNFATEILLLHNQTIGLDRILYSIDYPFVPMEQATEWVNSLDSVLSAEELSRLKRGAAIELLKLND
ncbi:amidohydrolase family protein [Moniliophthora roreri MCA 2997]|uniref:Amidohydrolase family protein n=1 Tax=Moniliophthora roreri (strain MCA 2997) TaxID=1381753 RepID=V2X9B8_MONRO|nr:amidohydrolase family protein [Moniliophthora roreri MCA 2997]